MPANSQNILLVSCNEEDHKKFKAYAKQIASAYYQFDIEQDYAKAVDVIAENKHDIVLLRHESSEHSAFDALLDIHKAGLCVPIVVLTDQDDRTTDERVIESGGMRCLNPAELSATDFDNILRATLRLHETQRDLKEAKDALGRLQEQAAVAAKTKSEFLANMSHELRTPLTAILGMADLLFTTDLNQDQTTYVKTFQKAGKSLLDIINDILEYSKIEAGQSEVHYTNVDFHDFIDKALKMMSRRAKDKGLELVSKIEDSVPKRLMCDQAKLNQVLISMLGNAIKFTSEGRIYLKVIQDTKFFEGYLLFTITDTGIGIPREKVKQIFSDFTQIDSSTTRRHGGTGLGLAIAKRLVEIMDGQLWVKSEEGKGSTFYFSLKFQNVEDSDTEVTEIIPEGEAHADEKGAGTSDRSIKCLFVDDAEESRMLFNVIMKKEEFVDIDLAKNGKEALVMASENEYDLIFMDMKMPEMDGFEATRAIRAWEREKEREATPIVALTALGTEESAKECLAAGCDEHLVKPLRKQQALEVIKKYANADSTGGSSPSGGEKIDVVISEDIRDLVPGYLENRQKDIQKITDKLEEKDFETIRDIGHKMKGSGGGYGFDQITTLGKTIENASKDQDAAVIEKSLEDLKHYLANLNISYHQA